MRSPCRHSESASDHRYCPLSAQRQRRMSTRVWRYENGFFAIRMGCLSPSFQQEESSSWSRTGAEETMIQVVTSPTCVLKRRRFLTYEKGLRFSEDCSRSSSPSRTPDRFRTTARCDSGRHVGSPGSGTWCYPGRVLVTHDARTMPDWYQQFVKGQPLSGADPRSGKCRRRPRD